MKFLNITLPLLLLCSMATQAKVAINTTGAFITDLNQDETTHCTLTSEETAAFINLYNNVLSQASKFYTKKLSSKKKRKVAYAIVELINNNTDIFSIAIDHREENDQIGTISKFIVDATIKAVKYKPRTKQKDASKKWKYITLQLPQNGCKILDLLK